MSDEARVRLLETKVAVYRNSEAALLRRRRELAEEVDKLRRRVRALEGAWPKAFPLP